METLEMVLYTAIFIVPGFVMAQIIDSINPKAKTEYGYHAIRCFYLSLIADISGCWIVCLLRNIKDSIPAQLYWIFLCSSMMLFSSVVAVLLGSLKHSQLWRRILSKLGIYSSHTIPYAWDYAFEQKDFFYVYITLIDGAQIYGLYYFNSFASSEPDDRDIFLEKVFDVTTENDIVELKERINTKGMLTRGNQISSIEFLK